MSTLSRIARSAILLATLLLGACATPSHHAWLGAPADPHAGDHRQGLVVWTLGTW